MAHTTIYATYILSIHVLYDSAVIHLLICSLKRMISKIPLSFELYLLTDNDVDQREISCFLRIYWAVYTFSKSISTATQIMIYKRPSTMPLINTIPRKSWRKSVTCQGHMRAKWFFRSHLAQGGRTLSPLILSVTTQRGSENNDYHHKMMMVGHVRFLNVDMVSKNKAEVELWLGKNENQIRKLSETDITFLSP